MKNRIFSLIITILMLVSLSSCSNGGIITTDGQTIAGKQAGNDAVDYSFAYPSDWELADNSGIILIRVNCSKSALVPQYASINVLTFALSDANTGARAYWDSYKPGLEETLKDFKLIGTDSKASETADSEPLPEPVGEEITLGDTVALKVRYSASITDKTYLYDQIICCRNGSVYLITLTSATDDYDNVKGALNTVTETFVFE